MLLAPMLTIMVVLELFVPLKDSVCLIVVISRLLMIPRRPVLTPAMMQPLGIVLALDMAFAICLVALIVSAATLGILCSLALHRVLSLP